MSDDLIGRLRRGEACEHNPCRVMDTRSGCICAEAASRIEALQAELADYVEVEEVNRDLVKRGDYYRDKAEAAEAREKALREALEKIANAPAWGAPDRWETTPSDVRQLARAALKGQP
jgi:hypothetical protein